MIWVNVVNCSLGETSVRQFSNQFFDILINSWYICYTVVKWSSVPTLPVAFPSAEIAYIWNLRTDFDSKCFFLKKEAFSFLKTFHLTSEKLHEGAGGSQPGYLQSQLRTRFVCTPAFKGTLSWGYRIHKEDRRFETTYKPNSKNDVLQKSFVNK